MEAAQQGCKYATIKLQKAVVFTALSTITPNMGQSNYAAANAFLDKIAPYERPEIDATGLMWGTVGGIGMRLKAFGSNDFMLQTPDLLMTPDDASKVLHVVATKMEMPEWVGANYMDPNFREAIVEQGAKVGGYKPSEDAYLYPSIPKKGPHTLPGPFDAVGLGAKEKPWREHLEAASRGQNQVGRAQDCAPPLGGWPVLASSHTHAAAPSSAAAFVPVDVSVAAESVALAADQACSPVDPVADLELRVGSQVQLVGLKSKSGTTGVVVKSYPEDRYKVALDGKKGSALLRSEYLQVIAPPRAISCH